VQAEFETPVSRADYAVIVEKAKDYIAAGDIFQVVPSHRFRARFGLDSFALYRSLRRTNPSPFLYFLNFGSFQLVGSSPEILVRLRDGKITIRPIAGTRPRGATEEEDAALEKELLADPKERAEHLMLLDLGRNDVGRVARLREEGRNEPPGSARQPSVRVTDSFVIERYSHVMHIVSNVEGDAPEGLDPVDVLMAALPAGTLSGAPKVRAMEIIDELEIEKRGLTYAGAVGYFGADGSVDTCIVLRTALVKDGMMYVQAGGGIVADSDPDAEYDETLHKSRALKRAAEEAWRFA
jgi:anthranilate synthase component 1